MKKNIPGINIQWPWSRLIVDGLKTIETRGYKLPEKYQNTELAIIETAGKDGKKLAGIEKAQIIGTVTFSKSKVYKNEVDWSKDYKKHLVSPDDKLFKYQESKEKWGWVISNTTKFDKPMKAPKKKGIVFATKCDLRL